jgi:hypothetical protein
VSHRDDSTAEREPDIVLVVLQRARAANPALTEAQAQQVEADIRAEFGGLRVRIPKRKKHPSAEERKAIFNEAMSSATDEEITERHGIHRATLYRMIKRGAG